MKTIIKTFLFAVACYGFWAYINGHAEDAIFSVVAMGALMVAQIMMSLWTIAEQTAPALQVASYRVANPPPLPQPGDMWTDVASGRSHIWDGSQWSQLPKEVKKDGNTAPAHWLHDKGPATRRPDAGSPGLGQDQRPE